MATITYTVDPGGTGDYTSLNACSVANATNLVGSGNNVIIECFSSDGTADTTAVDLTAWTCSFNSGETLTIACTDTLTASWNTDIYRLSVSNVAAAIRLYGSGIILDGLQIEVAATNANYQNAINIVAQSSNNPSVVKNCLCKGANQGTYRERVVYITPGVSRVIYFYNNVVYNANTTVAHPANSAIAFGAGVANVYMYKNVISGGYNNIFYSTGASNLIAKNTILEGASNALTSAAVTWDASSDYNATDQSSGLRGGINERYSQTFDFTDKSNGEYTLTADDTGAKGFGVDLSGDTPSVTTDRLGETLESPFDIGAYQFLGGGIIFPFNLINPLGGM